MLMDYGNLFNDEKIQLEGLLFCVRISNCTCFTLDNFSISDVLQNKQFQ